jgi:hypothetical protein
MVTRRDFNQQILATSVVAVCFPNGCAAAASQAGDKPADAMGALDEPTRSVLMATAEAVTGIRVLRGHYEAYYQHQALYRAGYLFLYRQYAGVADRVALRSGCANFLACDFSARVVTIGEIRSLPRVARLFEDPIFQETLAVFEKD